MKIRNAVVNGVRVFSVCDIARLLGVNAPSLTCTADKAMTLYFNGSHEDRRKSPTLGGLPFCEIERIFQKRLKRARPGNDVIPSILEWMRSQSDLGLPVEGTEIAKDFAEMTPEEIYETGRLDEFLRFVETQKEEAAERNNAIKLINQARIELGRLRDESERLKS